MQTPYIEQDCTFEHAGQKFTAGEVGDALVTALLERLETTEEEEEEEEA